MIMFHLVQFFLLCKYFISGTEEVCLGAVVFIKAFYYRCKKIIQNPPVDKMAQLTVCIKSLECNQ